MSRSEPSSSQWSGSSGWLRMLEQVLGRGGVVGYHGVGTSPSLPAMHVSPPQLRTQLEFLRTHYEVVTLREQVTRWRAGRSTAGTVSITFDDAYAGVARHAVPLLAEMNLPATIFVSSGFARTRETFWWDAVEADRRAAGTGPWTNYPAAIGLPPLDPRAPVSSEVVRDRVLSRFNGRWPAALPVVQAGDWRPLGWDELAALGSGRRLDFGCHTVSHPALPTLGREEQEREIRDGLTQLRDALSNVLPVIAFPYGLYDRFTVAAARAVGLIAGVTMEGRAPGRRPDLMTIPRVGVGEVHGARSIAMRLAHALRPAVVVRNRGVHPRVPLDPDPRQSAPGKGAITQ